MSSALPLLISRIANSCSVDDLNLSLSALCDVVDEITSERAEIISVLIPILRAEYREETCTIPILKILVSLCDADTSLQFLSEQTNFDVLLECLAHSNTLVQIYTIELLASLLNMHHEKVEHALLSCNLGLRRLMDVIASNQVHVKVRNDMLQLLNSLTQKNDRIKEFLSFSQGFELLFDIIDQEQSSGQLCFDCLALAKNLLSGNNVTKKMFAQSPVVARLPELLSGGFESTSSDGSNNGNFAPNSDVMTRCAHAVDLVLELLSCMGSGSVRIEQLLSVQNAEQNNNSSSTQSSDGLRKMHELQQLQQAICSTDLLLSLLKVTSVLWSSLAASASAPAAEQTCIDIMTRALDAVSALICGCAPNQAMLLSCKMVLPWGSQRVVTSVDSLAMILRVYTNVKSNVVHTAALGALSAFFCLNDDAMVSVVGHTIAPPPADLDNQEDRGLPRSESPGRAIVTLLSESATLLVGAELSTPDYDLAMFQMNAACDVLEMLSANNVTCKELLLRVKASPSSASTQSFLLDHCFRLIRTAAVVSPNNSYANAVATRLLRMVAFWVWNSTTVVDTIFQSPTQLSVLTKCCAAQTPTVAMYGAVVVGTCVATGSDGTELQRNGVFGFLENALGVESLHDRLDDAVSSAVEKNVVAFIRNMRRVATEKLVLRYTSGGGGGNSRGGGGGEQVGKLRERVRSLEAEQKSSGDLLVLLAHLDLENRVLVKHLQQVGGDAALNLAKDEAKRLLQKAAAV